MRATFTKIVLMVVALGISSRLSADETAEDTLRRAIQAVGGQRGMNRLKGPMMWMQRGTFYGMGDAVPFVAQYASRWPDWFREEIENAFAITVNGDRAWLTTAAGVTALEGGQLDERLKQARMAWANRLFPLADPIYRLTSVAGVQVNGRDTIGLKASHADQRDMTFYFDKQTYLLLKTDTMVITPQTGPDPVRAETFFWDHKSFGGAMVPSKFKHLYDGKLFMEGETIDYKLGATLDPQQYELESR